jgi:hypothetical protein
MENILFGFQDLKEIVIYDLKGSENNRLITN